MRIVDRYNLVVGALTVVLSGILGEFWYLFAIFLLFNLLDWLTGWHKAKKLTESSSSMGWKGAVKKVIYWVVIVVAFSVPTALTQLGQQLLGVNLSFLQLLGWFTLASLTVNEARSILENIVVAGYHVPAFLIKGLAVTQAMIEQKAKPPSSGEEWNGAQHPPNTPAPD